MQATFAVKFNRFRGERGHVFQGRYKSLPVEPEAIGAVCHYIHLNPVRAGLPRPGGLARWPCTSFPALLDARQRPAWSSTAAGPGARRRPR